MRKRSFRVKNLDNSHEIDLLNKDIDDLYKFKPEMVFHNSGIGAHYKGYQEIEHGVHNISGVVAASVQSTINFKQNFYEILNLQLTPIGTSFTARVVSYNTSSVTIQIEATASLGSANYKIFWFTVGSMEGK